WTGGAEVPGLHRVEGGERAAHCAKSPRPIQGADPGHDPPDTGDQPAAVDRGPHAIPHRMARLLRLLPDPSRAHEPGSVDPPKITLVSLAAVAERAQSLQRTAPSWRAKVPCSGRRRFTDGVLAHVRTPGGPTSPAQPLFRLTRSSPTPRLRPSLTQSNRRGTDPYARWWGRGGIAGCPPIPINPHATQPLELAARPADDIEIDPLQGRTQLHPVEVAVVVDPALNVRVVHLGEVLQAL